MTKDAISIKGDRNVWIDFVAECKRQKTEVWAVLEPYLKQFIKGQLPTAKVGRSNRKV